VQADVVAGNRLAFVQSRRGFRRGEAGSPLVAGEAPGSGVKQSIPSAATQMEQLTSRRKMIDGVMGNLRASRNGSANELEAAVEHFATQEEDAEDGCYARLLDAKNELNELHSRLLDLRKQVNATEQLMKATNEELNTVLEAIRANEEWKRQELKRCFTQRTHNIYTFVKVKEEMKELQDLARPAPVNGMNWLKENGYTTALLQVDSAQPSSEKLSDPGDLRALLRNTRTAAHELVSCMSRRPTPKEALIGLDAKVLAGAAPCNEGINVTVTLGNASVRLPLSRQLQSGASSAASCSTLGPNMSGIVWLVCNNGEMSANATNCYQREILPKASKEECEEKHKSLQTSFSNTYTQLTRMISTFETLSNDTSCESGIMEEFKRKTEPLYGQQRRMEERLKNLVDTLEEMQPRLTEAHDAEQRLRQQVNDLDKECSELPATTSDLSKVRDAIRALSLCPGLNKTRFSVLTWTGSWVLTEAKDMDVVALSDQQLDSRMHALCRDKGNASSRSAETAEIEELSVFGMPESNTASVPVIGTCPNCEGDADPMNLQLHASGHARVCWQVGQAFNATTRSRICSAGPKALLCVVDEIPPR